MDQSDASFSIDQLRKEEWERFKDMIQDQKRVIKLLERLLGTAYVIAAALVFIALK